MRLPFRVKAAVAEHGTLWSEPLDAVDAGLLAACLANQDPRFSPEMIENHGPRHRELEQLFAAANPNDIGEAAWSVAACPCGKCVAAATKHRCRLLRVRSTAAASPAAQVPKVALIPSTPPRPATSVTAAIVDTLFRAAVRLFAGKLQERLP